MNKVLSDTRYVIGFAALVIICATVLVALDKVLWADAVKVLSGLLGGILMAWKRGSEYTAEEAEAMKAYSDSKRPPATKPPVLPVLGLFLLLLVPLSCAESRPYLRTADDAATWACAAFYGKRQGMSLDEAARTFCKTKAQIQPWLDHLLALERQGVPAEKCEPATEVTVTKVGEK